MWPIGRSASGGRGPGPGPGRFPASRGWCRRILGAGARFRRYEPQGGGSRPAPRPGQQRAPGPAPDRAICSAMQPVIPSTTWGPLGLVGGQACWRVPHPFHGPFRVTAQVLNQDHIGPRPEFIGPLSYPAPCSRPSTISLSATFILAAVWSRHTPRGSYQGSSYRTEARPAYPRITIRRGVPVAKVQRPDEDPGRLGGAYLPPMDLKPASDLDDSGWLGLLVRTLTAPNPPPNCHYGASADGQR